MVNVSMPSCKRGFMKLQLNSDRSMHGWSDKRVAAGAQIPIDRS